MFLNGQLKILPSPAIRAAIEGAVMTPGVAPIRLLFVITADRPVQSAVLGSVLHFINVNLSPDEKSENSKNKKIDEIRT